jgi:hypothetical protein
MLDQLEGDRFSPQMKVDASTALVDPVSNAFPQDPARHRGTGRGIGAQMILHVTAGAGAQRLSAARQIPGDRNEEAGIR